MSDNPDETAYYHRIIAMYIDLATESVLKVFFHLTPCQDVETFFASTDVCRKLKHLKLQNILNQKNYELVTTPQLSPKNFDISLLIILLTNLYTSKLPAPKNGWKHPVASGDLTIAADLLRLLEIKSALVAHKPRERIEKLKFERLWENVENVLARLTQQVDPTSEATLREKINEYRNCPLDPTDGRSQKYLEKLKEWYDDNSKLQEKSSPCSLDTSHKKYYRFVRLLHDVGKPVLIGLLQKELSKRKQSLQTLLRCKLPLLIEMIADEELLEQLLPSHDVDAMINEDTDKWDILVLSSVLNCILDESDDEEIIADIKTVMDARKNYADIALMSLDDDNYTPFYAGLLSSLRGLSSGLNADLRTKCRTAIENCNKVSAEIQEIEKYFEELRAHGCYSIKSIADIYKEHVKRVKDCLTQMEKEGIPFRQVHGFDLKLVVIGADDKKRKAVEDVVADVWEAALRRSQNKVAFDAIRESVDSILDKIRGIPNVEVMKVERDHAHEETENRLIVPIKCRSTEAMRQVLKVLSDEETTHRFNEIEERLSYALDHIITLNVSTDEKSFKGIFEEADLPDAGLSSQNANEELDYEEEFNSPGSSKVIPLMLKRDKAFKTEKKRKNSSDQDKEDEAKKKRKKMRENSENWKKKKANKNARETLDKAFKTEKKRKNSSDQDKEDEAKKKRKKMRENSENWKKKKADKNARETLDKAFKTEKKRKNSSDQDKEDKAKKKRKKMRENSENWKKKKADKNARETLDKAFKTEKKRKNSSDQDKEDEAKKKRKKMRENSENWKKKKADKNARETLGGVHLAHLPNQKLLNEMWKKAKQSETDKTDVLRYSSDICNHIQLKNSDKVVCVWPSYDSAKQDTIEFVIITKELTDGEEISSSLEYSTKIRPINTYSEESTQVMKSEVNNKYKLSFEESENIRRAICNHGKELMHKHKYLSVLSGSGVRSKGFGLGNHELIKQACIVMYVHIKGRIPLDETEFPKVLDGIPVDVREGEFKNCVSAREYQEQLHMGCQIKSGKTGTLGGFADHPVYGLCGITCAHVVLSNEELHDLRKVTRKTWNRNEKPVYQPDSKDIDTNCCGQVKEAVYKSGVDDIPGVDLAIFAIERRAPDSGEFPDDGKPDMVFETGKLCSSVYENSNHVMKFGRTTYKTEGYVQFSNSAVRPIEYTHRYSCRWKDYTYSLFNQFEIKPIQNQQKFAQQGDSGSLVFKTDVSGDLLCIGMVVGVLEPCGSGIVIPVSAIKSELGVSEFKSFSWNVFRRMDSRLVQIQKQINSLKGRAVRPSNPCFM